MRTLAALLLLTGLTACDRGPAPAEERSMKSFKTSSLIYPGRWAESAPGCSDKWWDFGSDQVKTRDNLSCIFQRETPTAAGVDLEVACIGQGMSTVEQWRLAAVPGGTDGDRMTLTRNAEVPLLLTRCPEVN